VGNRRIWCGLSIMAAGFCAAWPFRKTLLEEDDFPASVVPAAVATLADRPAPPKVVDQPAEVSSPAIERSVRSQHGLEPLTAVLDQGVPRRKLVKVDQTGPLPRLPASYASQSSESRAKAASTAAIDSELNRSSVTPPSPPHDRRYYRIRRHDTLEDIAERMLGSREHADKLLAANADVILAREILPVGAAIVIPDLHEPTETFVRVPEKGN
jgi:phage tail protein X